MIEFITRGDPEYEYDPSYKVLLFCHNEMPDEQRVRRYMNDYHDGCKLILMPIDTILNTTDSDIFDNIKNNMYSYFYITTDNKKIRSKIRNLVKEKCGIDIHIGRYSKIVNYIDKRSMRKQKYEGWWF